MPEMGAPTPPTTPPPAQPNTPNPGANDASSQASESAGQAIQSIQTGFKALAQLIQSAKGQVSPDDVKLFERAVSATDDFLEAITGGGDGDEDDVPGKGPMPANGKRGAPPAQYT